jgi:GT2 family glycosyltransferase
MSGVSFVIPTYNRAAVLVDCLLALDRQRRAGISFDIIVVDDGSRDATVDAVERLRPRLSSPVQVLRQENQGPAAARNRGVAAACGDLIVFLGDDIIVEPDYLAHLYAAYQAHPGELRGILGHTRYAPASIPTPFGRWLDKESGLQFDYRRAQPGRPLGWRFFYTSNILVPRDALVKMGGFNPGFRHAAYEDAELGYRLDAAGFRLYYAPTAQAVHRHPVSVQATARRMATIAQAALELRALNPELFAQIYAGAEARFGEVSVPRRLVRWAVARPGIRLLAFIDSRLRWSLPGPTYERILGLTTAWEIMRLWKVG